MERTVCELFAGVGGFRYGLNKKEEAWKTVWFNNWEPKERAQWAHGCYVNHFGTCMDLNGNDTTNKDIHTVDKSLIPAHTLLVAGFPCQSYSVAATLATSKGIKGEKGKLWWDIREVLEEKEPPFVLLENVDRLLKSPANQQGRDFAIILACFRDLDYTVEWRVINAADYGMQQRRRRVFIFAYKNNTKYGRRHNEKSIYATLDYLIKNGIFAKAFPAKLYGASGTRIPRDIGRISDRYKFEFDGAGVMHDGHICTMKAEPCYNGKQTMLGDILEETVNKSLFVPRESLYYTSPLVTSYDESKDGELSADAKKTWQFLKGGKKLYRQSKNGHSYMYSEGAVQMIDSWHKPARTLLTSEGRTDRSTHLVKDKKTGELRILSPVETERIQGFPDNWTKEGVVDGKVAEIPDKKRKFLMGNALMVDIVYRLGKEIGEIVDGE